MSEIADRYRRVAAGFTERVRNVPEDRWDAQAPCEEWKARDVPLHLASWMPDFFKLDVEVPEDPAGAWEAVNTAVQAALDDPERAKAPFDSPMADTFEGIVDAIGVTDVLIHTWDLARATGQDETIDAEVAERVFRKLEPMDSMMRGKGNFGPRIDVAGDADAQTRLLAFTGRQP
jgi:uncharacterized protein (TIGR03086 family)